MDKVKQKEQMKQAELREMLFRDTAIRMTADARTRIIRHADKDYLELGSLVGLEKQSVQDHAGVDYSFGLEFIFKALLIYYDLRKVPSIPANNEESLATFLDANLSKPQQLQKRIKELNPSDTRVNLVLPSNSSYKFSLQSMLSSENKPNGHDLFCSYQLVHPTLKTLINSNYYSSVDDEINYALYAILTEDIILSDGKPSKKMQEKLDEYHNAAFEQRYASINLKHVEQEELEFLRRLGHASLNVCQERFPGYNVEEVNDYYLEIRKVVDKENAKGAQSVFAKEASFYNLDLVSKFNLLQYFNNNEINCFINCLKKMRAQKYAQDDLERFTNLAISIKFYFTSKNIKLTFDENVFKRLIIYYSYVNPLQIFDDKTKTLIVDFPEISERKNDYLSKIGSISNNDENNWRENQNKEAIDNHTPLEDEEKILVYGAIKRNIIKVLEDNNINIMYFNIYPVTLNPRLERYTIRNNKDLAEFVHAVKRIINFCIIQNNSLKSLVATNPLRTEELLKLLPLIDVLSDINNYTVNENGNVTFHEPSTTVSQLGTEDNYDNFSEEQRIKIKQK